MNGINVNDGGGLFDYAGLIDTLVLDCNDIPKAAFAGEYVRFCVLIVGMVQKLNRLKDGVRNDIESRENIIAELKRMNEELTARNGGNHADT